METKPNRANNGPIPGQSLPPAAWPQTVLFARTPQGARTIGVVTEAAPSSLALLAAGVAGLAMRRARRNHLKK